MPPRLTLCVIARDAAATLGECLASGAVVADELLVVDTGSGDNTPGVAQRLGARILSFPWQDDFALARNFALEQATGDWVLYLDADEVLFAEDGPLVRELVQKEETEAYFIHIHNLVDARGREVVSPAVRLLRRRPEYRWTGRVHEQILPSIVAAGLGRVEMSGVRLRHYGYLPEEVAGREKIRRNLRLLELELSERPGDPFTLFNLGVEKQRLGLLEEALACFEKARPGLPPTLGFVHLLEKRR
ncbi:MAG: glycosyltransferase, partial [Clostridia bacterium]|nr:glycosyltransferase [Clostridia bacterium]